MGSDGRGPIVAESVAMRRVVAIVREVAPTSVPVILEGESGTGKEIIARAIHEFSLRRNGPYVGINCAALPEGLAERELFGHERGAFTSADERRGGCFEIARGGTLLLDELTEMKPELQAKLLRVIEERKFRRLGGTSDVTVDVRLLATTNRNLADAVNEGRLREDLYYRLSVFTVKVPSLAERIEDIPLLTEYFIRQFALANGKSVVAADDEFIATLKNRRWRGNVRELRNVIERAVIVTRGTVLSGIDLPAEDGHGRADSRVDGARIGSLLKDIERQVILKTLEVAGGSRTKTAEILGISPKTLYNKLERYKSTTGEG
jgi:two-component system, NtrC family, response regulator HydG